MELEPMRQFGVNMTAANLEAYALSTGVNKVWAELTNAEQTIIRYNYLLENTVTAQGDAIRSADSYATSVKQVQLAVSDAGATFGENLLPSLTSINQVFEELVISNKSSIDLFGALIGIIGNLVAVAFQFVNVVLAPLRSISNILAEIFLLWADGVNLMLEAWIDFWDDLTGQSKDSTNAMGYDLQEFNQIVEEVNLNSITSFKDMYSQVEGLSGEHYDKLKGLAKEYNDMYTAQNDALDQYVSDSLRRTMGEHEKSYQGRTKTAQDYMKLARIEAREREKLEGQVNKEREHLDSMYMGKLKSELARQQEELKQQNNVKNTEYENDVKNFAKAEQEKTRIFKEEAKKRVSSESSGVSSSGGFSFGGFGGFGGSQIASAGRSLTAYNAGNNSNSNTSSNSTYNFNVSGMSVEQVLSYAKQKNRLRG